LLRDHDSGAQKTVNGPKRQSNFGSPDVNAGSK
jgi:hypothetical protein